MKSKLYYEAPESEMFFFRSERNFLFSGGGEDADPKTGNWLFYYDELDS